MHWQQFLGPGSTGNVDGLCVKALCSQFARHAEPGDDSVYIEAINLLYRTVHFPSSPTVTAAEGVIKEYIALCIQATLVVRSVYRVSLHFLIAISVHFSPYI